MRKRSAASLVIWVLISACSGHDDEGTPMSGAGPSGSGAIGGAEASSGGMGGSGAGGNAGTSSTGGAGAGGINATDAGPDTSDASDPADGAAGSSAPTGPFAIEALPFSVTSGQAIDAPNGEWTFVAFPDSRCANGTPTGIAINPIANPQGLLVFMQGGGACWDGTTCLETNTSVHLDDTVGEAIVLSEADGLSGLFEHDNPGNPFADYAYVYMPYCTGDLHAGTQEKIYDGPAGAETIHHHGGRNVEAYLKRLVPSLPGIARVVVSGISAGGFGATFNWWRYQGAFPNARVDVLDDAGLLVDSTDDRWSIMVGAWAMVLPPGCTACAERMSAFLPFYGQHLVAPRRYALTGFLGDATIASYFGLSSEQVSAQLLQLRANAADNQKTFFLGGTQHTVIGEGALMVASDGKSLLPWILELASDAPTWDHAGP